jgi:putative ABC transport system permease protein
VGIVLGLLLGKVINDYLIVPTLLANLNLPSNVRADWTLQTVLIPTGITLAVLALATISPARAAASTKVMVVLNPAAADQPTLDDLAQLREKRASKGLLLAGLVLLGFSAVILIVLPTVFTSGNASGMVAVTFGSLLLMVIGISLLFYFVTTPLERVLVKLYQAINPKAGYFAGRYTLRGKGRNAFISLMVVMSGVLPTLLATQLALQEANLDTDTKFSNGAPLIAQNASAGGGGGGGGGPFRIFQRTARTDVNLSDKDIAAVLGQPGIGTVIGIADNFPGMRVTDDIALRSATVSLIGVQGDLREVLYPNLFRWTGGDSSALTRIATDENVAIISEGLSQALDLKVGDVIKVTGNGNDHVRTLSIIGVAARIPGFSNYFTRNQTDANRSAILMNLETYRELKNNPANGSPNLDESLLTKLMATAQAEVDETTLVSSLRDYLVNNNSLSVTATSESVAQNRSQLQQTRIFTVLLTGLSMVTAIFGVLAVMYTAVMSRRVEIGMLKAVGASKGALRGVFIGEAIITTLAAGIAGIVAGTLLGYAFEGSQRLQQDQLILLAFDFRTAGIIVALVCLAALFSSILATQPVIKQKAIKILRER